MCAEETPGKDVSFVDAIPRSKKVVGEVVWIRSGQGYSEKSGAPKALSCG